MAVFLFDEIIFGPVQSRRLGVSLGINLLPRENKFCNFDCIYCECGRTYKDEFGKSPMPTREQISERLREVLEEMAKDGKSPDTITFAGNGEPTIHPEFPEVIKDTLQIRDELVPTCSVAVLSNATQIHKPLIVEALKSVDQNILKLDSGFDETVKLLNNPPKGFTVKKLTDNLKAFDHQLIIQIMFVKGEYQGKIINNATEREVNRLHELLDEIRPKQVMIYTIARDTPSPGLRKVSPERLKMIAQEFEKTGHKVQISE
jgi:wyosine [tRNA(Phe)-imidazoG37] synthetase (radical SAM superfamily)